VLQTDGAGNLSFAESSGGGGGNNTATSAFEYNRLTTSSTVIDEFDLEEYRAAVYHIGIEDVTNSLFGHTSVNLVHDGSDAYITQFEDNEDSTNLITVTAAVAGTKVQLSASANAQSSHVNLRIYRVALGDHHETVANTNSKIIVSASAIDSVGTIIDQFTKTDIQSAKYYILIKNATNGDYQISQLSLVHNGTTAYFNDYAKTPTSHLSNGAQTPKGCTPSAMGAESDTAGVSPQCQRSGVFPGSFRPGRAHTGGVFPDCCARHANPITHDAIVCFPREDEACHL